MRRTFLLTPFLMLALGSAMAASPSAAVDQLLTKYYGIHKSLAADSLSDVAKLAAEIEELSRQAAGKETHTKKLLMDVSVAAGKLNAANLKSARNGFSELSEKVIAYVKASGVKTNPPYQFYCSMLKKNWLQPDKSTRNPYYGSEMPKCGELVQLGKKSEPPAQQPMEH